MLLMLLLTFHMNNPFTVEKHTASVQGIDTEYYYTMVIDNTNLLDCFVTLPADGRKSQLYRLTKMVKENSRFSCVVHCFHFIVVIIIRHMMVVPRSLRLDEVFQPGIPN